MNFTDWGLTDYQDAWKRQQLLFQQKIQQKQLGNKPEHDFILTEHNPVYTLGRHGDVHNMLLNSDELQQLGATLVHIDRGGDITFHGIGQIVGYPIVDLEQLGIGLKRYIWILEEIIIQTIVQWGIQGKRIVGATGVWVESQTNLNNEDETVAQPFGYPRKICAIGVRASRYVTMHGFALNINTDLRYFSYINPCGFTDRGVTSLAHEVGHAVSMEEVKKAIIKNALTLLGDKPLEQTCPMICL